MKNEFLKYCGWLKEFMDNNPYESLFPNGTKENRIMKDFRNSWDQLDLPFNLKQLDEKYGETAQKTVEKYLEITLTKAWEGAGKNSAHLGTEREDFIKVLWEPLGQIGFEFTQKQEGKNTVFNVTKCPIANLAEKSRLHDWLYTLACATDFFSTKGFSPKLGFARSKTLLEGDDCCDHTYFYK